MTGNHTLAWVGRASKGRDWGPFPVWHVKQSLLHAGLQPDCRPECSPAPQMPPSSSSSLFHCNQTLVYIVGERLRKTSWLKAQHQAGFISGLSQGTCQPSTAGKELGFGPEDCGVSHPPPRSEGPAPGVSASLCVPGEESVCRQPLPVCLQSSKNRWGGAPGPANKCQPGWKGFMGHRMLPPPPPAHRPCQAPWSPSWMKTGQGQPPGSSDHLHLAPPAKGSAGTWLKRAIRKTPTVPQAKTEAMRRKQTRSMTLPTRIHSSFSCETANVSRATSLRGASLGRSALLGRSVGAAPDGLCCPVRRQQDP